MIAYLLGSSVEDVGYEPRGVLPHSYRGRDRLEGKEGVSYRGDVLSNQRVGRLDHREDDWDLKNMVYIRAMKILRTVSV